MSWTAVVASTRDRHDTTAGQSGSGPPSRRARDVGGRFDFVVPERVTRASRRLGRTGRRSSRQGPPRSPRARRGRPHIHGPAARCRSVGLICPNRGPATNLGLESGPSSTRRRSRRAIGSRPDQSARYHLRRRSASPISASPSPMIAASTRSVCPVVRPATIDGGRPVEVTDRRPHPRSVRSTTPTTAIDHPISLISALRAPARRSQSLELEPRQTSGCFLDNRRPYRSTELIEGREGPANERGDNGEAQREPPPRRELQSIIQ